jgi:UDP-glucose:(heptosyl)LPS alpha-1,3-glucosyltransferase
VGALTTRLSYALDPHRRLWANLERQAVASAQAVLAGSEMVAGEIRRYYGRQEGVHVVFNGVEIPDVLPDQRDAWRRRTRDELGVGSHVTVFLTVATNFSLKGVDYAIRGLASLGPDVPVHLAVVGPIPSSTYVRLAKRLGVRKRVTFHGLSKDIFRWYSAADAVVLLSWYDACSRVVLEATRWSVPSITTTFNGAAEALADGAGVVVARPDDTPAVAEAMRSLCDEGQRSRRRTQCEQIADRLSLDHHVSELLRVYEALPAPKE